MSGAGDIRARLYLEVYEKSLQLVGNGLRLLFIISRETPSANTIVSIYLHALIGHLCRAFLNSGVMYRDWRRLFR